jgi:hypothetical protein
MYEGFLRPATATAAINVILIFASLAAEASLICYFKSWERKVRCTIVVKNSFPCIEAAPYGKAIIILSRR